MSTTAAPLGAHPDFGSLHDFLTAREEDVLPSQTKRPCKDTGLAAPGIPMPVRPQQKEGPRDGTVLNRKVAFKMLKQLGCEVRRPTVPAADQSEKGGVVEGDPYIEVSLSDQPVLFQMLIDWGYKPFRSPQGLQIVHVTDSRKGRTQEEVVNALSAPRPPPLPRLTETDGWPAVGGRPTMRPDEEQELIKRLAAPRLANPAPEPAQAATKDPAKVRTASEQKANMERLMKPKVASEELDTSAVAQGLGRHAPPGGGLPPRPRTHVTWPAATLERRTPDGAASKGRSALLQAAGASSGRSSSCSVGGSSSSSSGSLPVRPSPRLTQAGASAVGLTPSVQTPDAEADSSDAGEHRDSFASKKHAPGASQGKDTLEWIEKLMGPTSSWPGKPSGSRTKAEQQERLQRLAKPRAQSEPPPEETAKASGAPRSPRSQRDACSRLAEPRRRPSRREEEQGEAGGEEGGEALDERGAEEPADGSEAGLGAGEPGDGQRVVVIPSLLTQLHGHLEPIAEDAPEPRGSSKPGAGRPRRKARCQSVPAIAAPYAVPVLPPPPVRIGPSGGGAAGRGPSGAHREQLRGLRGAEAPYAGAEAPYSGAEQPYPVLDPMEDALGSFIAQALGSGDAATLESESMLASIDLLYNQVLGQQQRAQVPNYPVGLEGHLGWVDHPAAGPPAAASEGWSNGYGAPAQVLGPHGHQPFEMTRVPGYPSGLEGHHGWVDHPAAGPPAAASEGWSHVYGAPPQASAPQAPALQQQPAVAGLQPHEQPAAAGPQPHEQPAAAGLQPREQPAPKGPRRAAPPRQASRAAEGGEEGTEALLANIDRLYGEMLQGGTGTASSSAGPAAARGAAAPAGAAAPSQPPAEASAESGGDQSPAAWSEVREVLEEVLWSAMLTGRGTGGRIDMQAMLLEMLPPETLAQCVGAAGRRGLPPSLLHRLQAELPRVHGALTQPPADASHAVDAADLARTLREARDGLLALASSEVSAQDLEASAPVSAAHTALGESVPGSIRGPETASRSSSPSASANLQGSRLKKSKPRRTSLSYWTPESLESLEPPKYLGSKKLKI